MSIPCTLGSDTYKYIDISMSPVTYATLDPLSQCIVPAPPEPINVVNNATQYQISHATALRETTTHTFCTYQLVQRALTQKALEALDVKYLTRLHNRVSGQVPGNIRTLMLHLFQVYGKITAKKLSKNKTRCPK